MFRLCLNYISTFQPELVFLLWSAYASILSTDIGYVFGFVLDFKFLLDREVLVTKLHMLGFQSPNVSWALEPEKTWRKNHSFALFNF